MSRKRTEQLLDTIGDIDERYIQEYLNGKAKTYRFGRTRMRLSLALAAAMIMLLGTVALAAAIPAIGHFLANLSNEQKSVIQNFDEIESQYAVFIGDTQEYNGVTGTLNSVVVEKNQLLLSYTFDWGGLEEAADGSFHTYFLPWFFYITDGDDIICQSMYTKGLHTQIYSGEGEEDSTKLTALYSIDLDNGNGEDLVGRELSVQLLYSAEEGGFSSTFTPKSCFTGRSWKIDKAYTFGEHEIRLDRVEESALYVTLFLDCDTIGHSGDEYAFVLSDELGNDYTVYPYGNNNTDGYWFTKPETMGAQLTLKVIRGGMSTDQYGNVIDDSYIVVYEIPIAL